MDMDMNIGADAELFMDVEWDVNLYIDLDMD